MKIMNSYWSAFPTAGASSPPVSSLQGSTSPAWFAFASIAMATSCGRCPVSTLFTASASTGAAVWLAPERGLGVTTCWPGSVLAQVASRRSQQAVSRLQDGRGRRSGEGGMGSVLTWCVSC